MRLVLLALLLIPSICFGGWSVKHVQVVDVGGSDCMDGTYILAWDGDHSSGTEYICDSGGAGIAGTNTGLTMSTALGESGSNGSEHDSQDERVLWSQTSKQYLDTSDAQTIWMRVYISGQIDNEVHIFESVGETTDYVDIKINTNEAIIATYRSTDGSIAECGGTSPGTGSWVDIAYSWDRPNTNHSVNTGDSWQDDVGELTYDMTTAPTTFTIGNHIVYQGSTPSSSTVRVDRVVLVTGYKATKPW